MVFIIHLPVFAWWLLLYHACYYYYPIMATVSAPTATANVREGDLDAAWSFFEQGNDVYSIDPIAAIALYHQAIRIEPTVYAFHTNLGESFRYLSSSPSIIIPHHNH